MKGLLTYKDFPTSGEPRNNIVQGGRVSCSQWSLAKLANMSIKEKKPHKTTCSPYTDQCSAGQATIQKHWPGVTSLQGTLNQQAFLRRRGGRSVTVHCRPDLGHSVQQRKWGYMRTPRGLASLPLPTYSFTLLPKIGKESHNFLWKVALCTLHFVCGVCKPHWPRTCNNSPASASQVLN